MNEKFTGFLECIDELSKDEYNFMFTNDKLKQNIILFGLGGSRSYGTNTPESDWDFRGITLNSKEEILLGKDFETVTNNITDTTFYSFNKIIKLLKNCNPNTIELLGLNPEHYIFCNSIGKELLDNKHLFLSKKAATSFGGYATAQFRRLDNKTARILTGREYQTHIKNSLQTALDSFHEKYKYFEDNAIELFVSEDTNNPEILMNVMLTNYPLEDYKSLWSELNNIVTEYKKIGHRNKNAIEHGKINKHMMHLVRLYLMCFDLLEKEEIITYRKDDLDLLMDIRNGKYLNSNSIPIPEFFEMVNNYEKRLEYAKNNTSLPDEPNYLDIDEFVLSVNERIVKGEYNYFDFSGCLGTTTLDKFLNYKK